MKAILPCYSFCLDLCFLKYLCAFKLNLTWLKIFRELLLLSQFTYSVSYHWVDFNILIFPLILPCKMPLLQIFLCKGW